MTGSTDLGRALILVGAALVVVGVLFTLGGRLPWPPRLPGDVLLRRGGLTLYLPITTCLLASLILTLLFRLLRR